MSQLAFGTLNSSATRTDILPGFLMLLYLSLNNCSFFDLCVGMGVGVGVGVGVLPDEASDESGSDLLMLKSLGDESSNQGFYKK